MRHNPHNEEGLRRAVEMLHTCVSPHGFIASPTRDANYRRIWGRDGAIISLAALLTDDDELIDTARRTLLTLAEHQGPHGEIPSNVDRETGRISYGGTTGRVDADLWFVVGCGAYWTATRDRGTLERLGPALEGVRFLLGAWEFNNRGLIYVPQTGDWADEYLQYGYVLYDQLLYLQAQRTFCALDMQHHGVVAAERRRKLGQLLRLIRANFWRGQDEAAAEDIYHEVIFEKGHAVPRRESACHWLPHFGPHGYGYRFDAFANVLVSLLDVANDAQRACVDDFIRDKTSGQRLKLLPAFLPVIKPVDEDWQDLQMIFSYRFKNNPYEYHNGGLWPMLTGFYVADLARRNQRSQAEAYLWALHEANALPMDGEAWSFPEYVHGKEFTAGGNRHQGWSAAAAIIGHAALAGRQVFEISGIEALRD
jgi:hypothetical protein